MNPRDFLDQLPTRWRNDPGWQFMAEMLRVDADFRTAYLPEGSGGFSTNLDLRRTDEILVVLRSLPDDAPREQIAAALAPFRRWSNGLTFISRIQWLVFEMAGIARRVRSYSELGRTSG